MPRYIESYLHLNAVGVLVELSCSKSSTVAARQFQRLALDIAMHIARSRPVRVDRRRAPNEELDEFTRRRLERAPLETPDDKTLLAQKFVVNPSQTVGAAIAEAGKKLQDEIRVVRFARLEAGEP